jgi:DnaK suppressor protein
MTKTELSTFRKALENKQAELRPGSLNREAVAISTSPEELDRIQDANDRDWAMSNLERNSNRLREVRAALRRMEGGAFGVCAGCEENISPKRLAAVPWASHCIACQEAADREQNPAGTEIEPSFVIAA